MSWLDSLDRDLFCFINLKLRNPILDAILPQFSSNDWFFPVLILLAVGLCWKGGTRGRLLVLMLALIIAVGDSLVINTLKHAFARPRPSNVVPEAILLVGRGGAGSMPSSHTSTWFAATLITFAFYRRSWRVLLPFAVVMGFSRVYLGVHYPFDVLVGAVLGAGYAIAGLWAINGLWIWAGQRWFPDWWSRLPSLLEVSAPGNPARPPPAQPVSPPQSIDVQWLRLGYLLIAVLFVTRLIYIGSGRIELSEDEAYQWLWSKHLALSYYSKPPMIALAQFLGTSIWGDSEFGVRFLSPVISAALSLILLRFMAREVHAAAGFWLVALCSTAPLLAVGSTLMTVDPLLVFFWTCAMLMGWRAVQPNGTTTQWLWTGLLMGLGVLSKYTAAIQIASFALFLMIWPPARAQLRRPGPWLGLLVFALCTLPVVVWNAQHEWITVHHVGENAKLDKPWKPTLQFFLEFLGAEAGLMNPVYFGAAVWASLAFWRRRERHPLLVYLFAMSAPVFYGYWAYSLHSRILPNWIAAAVIPMFCLAVVYWDGRWREGSRAVRGWLTAGVAIGTVAVIICHDTGLIHKVIGLRLPPKLDPLRRVDGWKETAQAVGRARAGLLAEGREVLIIGSHYGLTGQISFYLPDARRGLPEQPLVYYRSSDRPRNQFYFWPGYRGRHTGANAIYVDEAPLPSLKRGWFWHWLSGNPDLYGPTPPPRGGIPKEVMQEFESVTELGIYDIKVRGQVLRRLQLFACRNLL
jgi:membrane-associated phospholipid phosphatase